jgi:hypothetical protein
MISTFSIKFKFFSGTAPTAWAAQRRFVEPDDFLGYKIERIRYNKGTFPGLSPF